MITLEELRVYLAGILNSTEGHGGSGVIIAARMWKRFTPEALDLWTTSGVLEHIAGCLAPAADEDEADEDDEP